MNPPALLAKPITDANSVTGRITIIYEDRVAGIRAKRFSDQLGAMLGLADPVIPACWRSELVELPELADEMARDAAASEFLILSLRGDRGLSLAMKRWIESWLAGASGGTASLVALFDPNRGIAQQADGVRCYLRDVTAGSGVTFFAWRAATLSQPEGDIFPTNEEDVERTKPRRRRSPHLTASLFPAAAA